MPRTGILDGLSGACWACWPWAGARAEQRRDAAETGDSGGLPLTWSTPRSPLQDRAGRLWPQEHLAATATATAPLPATLRHRAGILGPPFWASSAGFLAVRRRPSLGIGWGWSQDAGGAQGTAVERDGSLMSAMKRCRVRNRDDCRGRRAVPPMRVSRWDKQPKAQSTRGVRCDAMMRLMR